MTCPHQYSTRDPPSDVLDPASADLLFPPCAANYISSPSSPSLQRSPRPKPQESALTSSPPPSFRPSSPSRHPSRASSASLQATLRPLEPHSHPDTPFPRPLTTLPADHSTKDTTKLRTGRTAAKHIITSTVQTTTRMDTTKIKSSMKGTTRSRMSSTVRSTAGATTRRRASVLSLAR